MPLPARIVVAIAALACCTPLAAVADEPKRDEKQVAAALEVFRGQVQPLLAKYCQDCHSGDEPMGELKLDDYLTRATVLPDRKVWEAIAKKLHNREMPPEDAEQPAASERERITAWIDSELAGGNPLARDPGRVTMRRLNRAEYDNTIRDLVGVDFHPADDFPSDDVGYGFDNIGDVLSLPTILLEKYLAAAEEVSARALGTAQQDLATGDVEGGEPFDGGVRVLASRADVSTKVQMFGTGTYMVRVRAYGDQAGDEPVKMSVYLDKTLVRRFDVHAKADAPQVYEGWLNMRGGKRTISVTFENDYYEQEGPKAGDRNLYVGKIELMGPYPASFTKIIPREHTPEDKQQLAREVIVDLAGRAFRRPATPAEVERLLKLYALATAEGESFNGAIGLALEAMLVSPHFLFLVELDDKPHDPQVVRTLNEYELATRLSYFLWSSMPDDELSALARLGQLRTGDNLAQQVRRMLADPKSQALVENFAGQWLQLRNLATAAPDTKRYPDFDEALRGAMRKETELFFTEIMRADRSVLDFIDGDFTFVNERLARHYGLPDVKGEEFRRVQLDPAQRGGVVTQASVLTVTSNPTRTSPVKRGKWVLENLLGTPPPPPPPDVPELKDEGGELTGSLRERMVQHRAKAECAVCHKTMDPLGFGLENYDGIGGWRTKDGEHDIDSSGELPGGHTFAGPRELKGILKARQDDFVRALAEKMLTYALGRGVEYSDRTTVDEIAAAGKANDYKFSSLILGVVQSDAFNKRRGIRSEP